MISHIKNRTLRRLAVGAAVVLFPVLVLFSFIVEGAPLLVECVRDNWAACADEWKR